MNKQGEPGGHLKNGPRRKTDAASSICQAS